MSFTQNVNVCEPAKPNTTDWNSIKWNKVNRYVSSLQKRICRASRNNDKISHFFLLDKCSSEPYILKGARTVLKRA